MSDNTQPGMAGRIADLVLDGAALGGAALITYGVHLIFDPAGYIAGGLFMLGGAWIAARKAG